MAQETILKRPKNSCAFVVPLDVTINISRQKKGKEAPISSRKFNGISF